MYMVFQVIATFALLFFYVGALVYVLTRKSDGSRAKRLAATAVGILLFLHIGQTAFAIIVVRFADATTTGYALQIYSIVSSVGWMFAIGMLIRAAFLTSPQDSGFDGEFVDSSPAGSIPVTSENPYSPPAR